MAAGNVLTGNANLTFDNGSLGTAGTGGTVTLSGSTPVGTLHSIGTSAGRITSSSAVTLTLAGTGSGDFNGIISGPLSLFKNSSGTQILSGANTYTGNTTVSGGTLHFAKASAFYNSAINSTTAARLSVETGGTAAFNVGGTGEFTSENVTTILASSAFSGGSLGLDTSNAPGGAFTLADTVTGNRGLAKLGTGTLTLAGANTYTGATLVSGGTLTLGAANRLADTTALTVDTGATFNLAGFSETVGSLAGAGGVTLGAGTLGGTNATTTFGGVISGTGQLAKLGTGTLTLSGAQTYTGNTTVSAGTLVAGSTLASRGIAIESGATFVYDRASGDWDQNTASVTFSGSGTLRKTGEGQLRWQGTVATFALGSGSLIDVQGGTLVGGNFGNEVWTSNLSDLNVASGALFQGGEANVRVDALSGAGTIRSGFTGAGYQSFTFGVDNGSGTFSGVLSNNDTFAANFTKEGTGTQILSGANTYTGSTTISGGVLQIGDGGTSGSLASASIVNNAALRFNRSDASTFAGVISGSGTLTKLGAGTLTLSGANTYTGATTISGGTLTLGAANRLADTTALTVDTGATFNLAGFSETVGSLAGAGGVTLGAGTLGAGGNNATTTFGGVISGTGQLAKLGTGTLTLSGAQTYTGNTTVSAGTLVAGSTLASRGIAIESGATLVYDRTSGDWDQNT
ncbi:MAG: autotransporter-associated beta strand repeat-containing protein, partial [Opitutaceae bacterium]|nr:autotransporter-associated beta strand repeat-containing protein [Opitutaceae bacterium]